MSLFTRRLASVVKCLWGVFVWGVWGVVLVVCVSVSGVVFSVGVCVCVCDLLIFLPVGLLTCLAAPRRTQPEAHVVEAAFIQYNAPLYDKTRASPRTLHVY